MANQPPVVTAVRTEVQNPQVQAAMLLGSSYEAGWGPGFAVGDQGTSFGPYQMHEGGALSATGLTPAQAEDPRAATLAMEPYYESGVSKVPQSLWSSNPSLAAEEAAVYAESPAQSYLSSYGQSSLNSHWSAVQAAMNGQSVSSPGTAGGQNANLTSFGNTSPIPGLPSWLGNALNWVGVGIPSDVTDYLERGALIVFGAVLIIVGLVVLARGPERVANLVGITAAGASGEVKGAARGAGKSLGQKAIKAVK